MVTVMNDWVSVAEAAVLANREKSVIYRWIRAGKLRAQIDSRGVSLLRAGDVLRVEADQRRGRPRGVPSLRGGL